MFHRLPHLLVGAVVLLGLAFGVTIHRDEIIGLARLHPGELAPGALVLAFAAMAFYGAWLAFK